MKELAGALEENSKIPYLYIGTVTDIDDPKNRDRVRVRIMGMIDDDVPDAECPWAEQGSSLFGGTYEEVGISSVPRVGSLVWLAFAYGDTSRPVYIGYVRGASDASSLQKGGDLSNTIASKRDSSLKGPELPPLNSSTQYPMNNVIQSSSGNVLEMDDTPGNERVVLGHETSGAYFEIRPDGTVQIKSMKDFYHIVNGILNLYVEQDLTTNVKGSRTGDPVEDNTITVGGTFNVTSAAINLN